MRNGNGRDMCEQKGLRIDILVLCDFVLGVFLAVFAFAISAVPRPLSAASW